MRCVCGSVDADFCVERGYCVGPFASHADRDLADEERVRFVAMTSQLPSAGPTFDPTAELHEAAVEALAIEQARHTRWCVSCEADVFPVYPRQLSCHRCGEAFESELALAAE